MLALDAAGCVPRAAASRQAGEWRRAPTPLATRAHEKASLEDLGNAAPAALLVMAVGLLAVALLARANLGLRKPAARGIAGDGPV